MYLFRNAAGKIIYVGKARSLRDRVSSYFGKNLLPKTAALVSEIKKIDHIPVESEVDAFLLEANLIRKHQPYYNIAGKDGKNFPLVEINIKDPVPIVRIVRQETDPQSRYFGPYPTGSDIAGLLRFLRRIFPYVSAPHRPGQICLRSHLGLCPCPTYAGYKKNLKNLMDFLSGQRTDLQRKLEKEMQANAKKLNFEKAAEIKGKLDQITYITSGQNRPWQYVQNPNLVADRKNKEKEDLQKLLNLERLDKIEAYDISNTSGKLATGAQVVFVAGEPEKRLYRRYKIKLKNSPDDYAMLAEVLTRRLKSDIPLPDLFVIDGGKGQINAVLAKVKPKKVRPFKVSPYQAFPKVIGLAKRLETIYTDDGQEIQLSGDAPALQLLQRLRDEAHRFSRKYHFFLRSKKMLS